MSDSSSSAYPPTAPTPSDGEYPQIWEHHAALLISRQRLLQALLAFYLQKDDCIQEIFDIEIKMGLPSFSYVPQTTAGKNALTKFNSVSASYANVLDRYKSVYGL